MILGDVEEVITTVEVDDETYEEIIKVCAHDQGTACVVGMLGCSISETCNKSNPSELHVVTASLPIAKSSSCMLFLYKHSA